ncbi:MAG: response regulator transcription factor [Candidatus Nitricoxidivorans perseverans]|uniref:Response regulator transcription factor n=1 Tax=Candidatus Nitricoxidivorans perseverans TaxID=2975601 RepID=A0AA49FKR2_9PROT|nr:MAG: response regulator transcription factor [Candidatus Nitricoxidivorans perseverans]
MLKILVIEDHALVREGLLQALKVLEDEVETLGAQDADVALELLMSNEDVDLILLDLMLPGTSGMALLGVLRKRFPAIPVVILSALDDSDTVTRALRQGAAGFVPKSSSTDLMIDALHQVLAGEVYLPPRLRDATSRGDNNSGRGKSVADRYGLTQGQMRVLELLTQGKTNRQIADLLGVTEGTVKIHVSAIFKAMNVTNRSQALLLASRQRVRV